MRVLLDAGVAREIVNRVAMIGILDEGAFQYAELINAFVKSPPYPFEQTHAGYDQQIDALKAYDIRPMLPLVTTPTLIVSSPGDLLAPPNFQEELVKQIPGAEAKQYPGGHVFLGLPMNFEQFIKDVTEFWEKHR
jgi:pimeloyl-ACP methyl ester carboxylesterase